MNIQMADHLNRLVTRPPAKEVDGYFKNIAKDPIKILRPVMSQWRYHTAVRNQ